MLRTRGLAQSARPIFRCPSSIIPSLVSHAPLRNVRQSSNFGPPPPPTVPQYFPQQPPQYFPTHPPPPPLQHFPNQPTPPPKASTGGGFAKAILLSFVSGVFLGLNVRRNYYTGRLEFNCIPAFLVNALANINLKIDCDDLARWAKGKGLGEIIGLISDDEPPESELEWKTVDSSEGAQNYEGEEPSPSMKRMLDIAARVIAAFPPEALASWKFAFWHATKGSYDQFAPIHPLAKTYGDGQSIIHEDALDLMGNDDYFAFVIGRSIADAVFNHDGERLSTRILEAAFSAVITMFVLRRSQSRAKALLSLIPQALILRLGLSNWIHRRAEIENDVMAAGLVVTGEFDPEQVIGALRKLEEIQKGQPSRLPEFLSAKPSMSTRIKTIEKHSAEHKRLRELYNKMQTEQDLRKGKVMVAIDPRESERRSNSKKEDGKDDD